MDCGLPPQSAHWWLPWKMSYQTHSPHLNRAWRRNSVGKSHECLYRTLTWHEDTVNVHFTPSAVRAKWTEATAYAENALISLRLSVTLGGIGREVAEGHRAGPWGKIMVQDLPIPASILAEHNCHKTYPRKQTLLSVEQLCAETDSHVPWNTEVAHFRTKRGNVRNQAVNWSRVIIIKCKWEGEWRTRECLGVIVGTDPVWVCTRIRSPGQALQRSVLLMAKWERP